MLCKRERSNQLNDISIMLPSKELIDGIWQIAPDYIKIDISPVQKSTDIYKCKLFIFQEAVC